MAFEVAAKTSSAGKPDPALHRLVAEMAARPAMRDALNWFQRNRNWINEHHLELCRVPSATFFEQRRAEFMAERLRELGWESRIDRAGNVVAYPGGGREGPFVALTAHLDTVLAPRALEEIRTGADGRFYGPGVADNGSGLAALLAVAACWKQRRPVPSRAASLMLVANVGEEGEGNLNGMRFLCRQPAVQKIRSFLVLDGPGTDHITCRALASRRFEIALSGPGGHSWSDHGNANPVHALSRAIHFFTEEYFRGAYNTAPRSSFNFGLIEGGVSVNSIPALATAKVDLRSEDPNRLEELARALTVAVESAMERENERAAGGKLTARLRDIGSRPGGALAQDARILPFLRAVDAHLGIRSHLDCASTDANIPLSMGIEAISIGAGGQGGAAHTSEEWFDPEGRDLGLRRILLALALLLSN
jgi:acetylornithine deacetylase/succinyl-diaminopimelate desuccinylase-like protein